MGNILSIAHRGAKGYLPENTLRAFKMAFELGCDGIELDVHLSAEGEIMVIHDTTIDRTTNGSGRVEALTLKQIKNSAIPGAEIPKLSEVLEMTPKNSLVNIELKSASAYKPVADLVCQFAETGWNYDNFLISSFDWVALKDFREYCPQIPIGILTETDLDLAVAFAVSINAESVHPHYHLLTAENTKSMKQKGLDVYAWTINELADIQKIKSFNITGIITDFPDRV